MAITASPTNKSGNAIIYNEVHAFVRDRVESSVVSALNNRSPFLAYVTGRTKGDTNLGRPGALGFVGGGGVFDDVMRNMESGVERRLNIQSANHVTGKWMTENDTSPSTGAGAAQNDVSTAIFRWAKRSDAIKIGNVAMELQSQSVDKIIDLASFAVDEAMEAHFDALNEAIWHGTPADTEANLWSNLLGAIHAMNDDTNHYYGNLKMDATYWHGLRDTSAQTAGLNLIDKALFSPGSSQTPASNRANGFDLALCGPAAYFKIKQEALARGQSITVTDLPTHPSAGAKFEAIRYGQTWITSDPILSSANDWTTDDSDLAAPESVFALFNTDDWVFSTNPAQNFNVSPFFDASQLPGGDDAMVSSLTTMARFYCRRPWRQFLYTAVS